jgi:hypothetical protein
MFGFRDWVGDRYPTDSSIGLLITAEKPDKPLVRVRGLTIQTIRR